MTIDLKRFELRNGVQMPSVAFGCAFGNWTGGSGFQGFLPEQAWRALDQALDCGYRAFDGAHVYATEAILGQLLGRRFIEGDFERSDLFITSKLAHPPTPPHIHISHLRTWNPLEVRNLKQRLYDDYQKTLEELHLGYVDLLLMHWPGAAVNQDGVKARGARSEIWKTLIEIYENGGARAIGVSNFTIRHLQQLTEDVPELLPMVNQIEAHPYCRDRELENYCQQNQIQLTAYAPFASGAFGLLKDPLLVSLADKYGISVGQLILRWHLQQGRSVLPKSSNKIRMTQNLSLFDFTISESDMTEIDKLSMTETKRSCPDPSDIL